MAYLFLCFIFMYLFLQINLRIVSSSPWQRLGPTCSLGGSASHLPVRLRGTAPPSGLSFLCSRQGRAGDPVPRLHLWKTKCPAWWHLEVGPLGRWSGHDSGALWEGSMPLQEEAGERWLPLPALHHGRLQEKTAPCKPGSGSSPDTGGSQTPSLQNCEK